MSPGSLEWFGAVVQAGSILTGFCATFLAFRLQREATFKDEEKQHFTAGFFLIILATLGSGVFGFVLPLLGLVQITAFSISPRIVVGGMIGTVILLATYFIAELVHFEVLKKLDHEGWRIERWIIAAGIFLAWLSYRLFV